MSPRELIILLLGLAIVAVILRGLYVALQARRGQIRLAIDKNIPSDVDLDAMELAELPGGGARVVERSLAQVNSQNSALEAASSKAAAMDLGADDEESQTVPVLMDAVELSEEETPAPDTDYAADEDDEYASDISDDEQDEDPDSVLFDYGDEPRGEDVSDGMAGVTPDYPDQEEAEQTDWAAEEAGNEAAASGESSDHYDGEEAEYTEPEYDQYHDQDSEQTEERREPSLDVSADIDEFTMTAGERIGYESSDRKPTTQTGLFDEMDDEAEEVAPPKRKSLFAAFGRGKDKTRKVEVEQASAPEPEATEPEQLPDEPAVADDGQEQIETEPSEVLVINVIAREGQEFHGHELMQVLITSGLKFGEMNIFHQRSGIDGKGAVIFSVANILNPGTFDLNNMDQFRTIGISLFLALPSPINSLEAFEQLLSVAQQVRDSLDGELRDDNRNGMTAQTIEHYRQRIRDFELRQLKAAGSRA